jgi:hypothetical protein
MYCEMRMRWADLTVVKSAHLIRITAFVGLLTSLKWEQATVRVKKLHTLH